MVFTLCSSTATTAGREDLDAGLDGFQKITPLGRWDVTVLSDFLLNCAPAHGLLVHALRKRCAYALEALVLSRAVDSANPGPEEQRRIPAGEIRISATPVHKDLNFAKSGVHFVRAFRIWRWGQGNH